MIFLMAFLCVSLHQNRGKQEIRNFQGAILDTILKFLCCQLSKHQMCLLNELRSNIQKMAFSDNLDTKSIVENLYLADILDANLNFSKRSMITECHHSES